MQELKNMLPSSQLDKVLECLYPDKPPIHRALEIVEDLKAKDTLCSESEVIFILEKLIKDGFATMEMRNEVTVKGYTSVDDSAIYTKADVRADVAYYLISFEGKVRIQFEGGYSGILKSESEEKERIERLEQEQIKIQKRSLILTWIAGLVGAAVFVVTFLQYLLSVKQAYPNFPCISC